MKIKEIFNAKRIASILKNLGIIRFEVSHSSILRGLLIFIILLIAFTIRLLPIRWGFYLSEFDPYYQYRLTKYLVENGFLSWPSWHDYMSWYPWGHNIAKTSFPGLPFTAAFLYLILNSLGIRLVLAPPIDPLLSDPVHNFCVIFPVVMGTITCLVMYFLGKDIGGEAAGLFSAFLLALNPSYIGRTALGFFDDETVGIFSILLFMFFFLRAIEEKRSFREGLIYSVASGLSLGYLTASWGASRYPLVMTSIFAFVLLLIGRYYARLLLAYGITYGIMLLVAMNVPYLGVRFIREVSLLPVYGVFLLLCAYEGFQRMKTTRMKIAFLGVFLALCLSAFAALWMLGYVKPLQAKYLSVINPLQRISYPIVESVAEHRPSAWGTFYNDLGVTVFFIPIGIFFAIQMATNRSIFITVFNLTAIYFASSMIRLTLIMAPAACMLVALGLVRLAKPFVLFLREAQPVSRRKIQLTARLGKEFCGVFLIFIFLLLTLTFVIGTDFITGPQARGPRVFDQAYSPQTIAAASMPVRPSSTVTDWLDALVWMRENLPPSPQRPGEPGTVVACWWDYGYWITTIANKTTLADNGTLNVTQIAQIAKMFMSPEDEAIEILKKYNATHVVVFTTVGIQGQEVPWGEAGKFKWMIRIAHLNESLFGEDVSQDGQTRWVWSDYGKNTTLYKMMEVGKIARGVGREMVSLEHFELVYSSKGPDVNNVYALVLVFEVKY